MPEGKPCLSFIIPTFDNVEFIDDAIKSIIESIGETPIEYEILVGIDACEKTKEHVLNNIDFYKKFRVFYFNENVGPYVIKNTLVTKAVCDNICFFDSDDLMTSFYIEGTIESLNTSACIRYGYNDFSTDIRNGASMNVGEGIIFVKRDLFLSINGYYPWRCGADSEINERIHLKKTHINIIRKVCFYRRLHNKNLTRRPDTGFRSSLRKEYAVEIYNLKKKGSPNPEILHVNNDFVLIT